MNQKTSYCKDCRRTVTAQGANIVVVTLLIIIGVVLTATYKTIGGGLLMIITGVVYAFLARKKCPICNGSNFKEAIA